MIHKKRIRSLSRNFPHLKLHKSYYFAVELNNSNIEQAVKIGFTSNFNVGETILPGIEFGKVSKYNAQGKYVINKSLGKELHTYDILWPHQEFCGRGKTHEVTSIVSRTIKRWKREFYPAPEISLRIINHINQKFIVTPLFLYKNDNEKNFIHMVNLLLEIFGECEVLDNTGMPIILNVNNITYLNWEILPPGENPFAVKRIEQMIKNLNLDITQAYWVRERANFFSHYPATAYYAGKAGFRGYVIMEFKDANLLILENYYFGNAIYIFEGSFEVNRFISLTKKDILDGGLHTNRIIHNRDWKQKIINLFLNK